VNTNVVKNEFSADNDPEIGVVSEAAVDVPALDVEPPAVVAALPAVDSPGTMLRKAREARGESVSDVVQVLKLSAQQVEALERDRLDTLPGLAFARGFMRNYARHLGLDPDPLIAGIAMPAPRAVDLVPMFSTGNNRGVSISSPPPRIQRSVFLVLLGVLSVILLSGAIFALYKGWFASPRDDGDGNAAPAVAVTLAAPEPDAPPAASAAADDIKTEVSSILLEPPKPVSIGSDVVAVSADPAAGEAIPVPMPTAESALEPEWEGPPLRIIFTGDAWIRVRDAGGKLSSRPGRQGQSFNVLDKPPFSLEIRQADKVKLEFNGKPVDMPHAGRDGIVRLKLQ
jgi:cytoskeleton protein RodZ